MSSRYMEAVPSCGEYRIRPCSVPRRMVPEEGDAGSGLMSMTRLLWYLSRYGMGNFSVFPSLPIR